MRRAMIAADDSPDARVSLACSRRARALAAGVAGARPRPPPRTSSRPPRTGTCRRRSRRRWAATSARRRRPLRGRPARGPRPHPWPRHAAEVRPSHGRASAGRPRARPVCATDYYQHVLYAAPPVSEPHARSSAASRRRSGASTRCSTRSRSPPAARPPTTRCSATAPARSGSTAVVNSRATSFNASSPRPGRRASTTPTPTTRSSSTTTTRSLRRRPLLRRRALSAATPTTAAAATA